MTLSPEFPEFIISISPALALVALLVAVFIVYYFFKIAFKVVRFTYKRVPHINAKMVGYSGAAIGAAIGAIDIIFF